MSTTSPASAARSVPDPTAMPTAARARAGASLTPSPTKATEPRARGEKARVPASRPAPVRPRLATDPFRLLGRQQFRVHLGDGDLLGHGLRHRRAVAGEQRDGVDAQRPQLGEHGRRLRPEAVAGADDAEDHAVPGHDERRLPGVVELFGGRPGLRRESDALFLHQPPRADDERGAARGRGDARRPAWAWNPSTGGGTRPRAAAAGGRRGPAGVRCRCSAVAAASRTSSAVAPPTGITSPSSSRPR